MFLGRSVSSSCVCEPGAVVWIEQWFHDCIYTQWELFGFLIGLSSVFFWMIAQMPQFLSNILRQSADALSPWFLLQWLAGDSFNLLGCLFTGDQLSTETFTAVYFIFADSVIMSQYLYYQPGVRDKLRGYYSDESLHKPLFGYKTVTGSDPEWENRKDGASTSERHNLVTNSVPNKKDLNESKHISMVISPKKDTRVIRDRQDNTGESKVTSSSRTLKDGAGCCHEHLSSATIKGGRQNSEEKFQHLRHCATPHECRNLQRIVMEYGLEYNAVCVPCSMHQSHPTRFDLRRGMNEIGKKLESRTSKSRIHLKKALCLSGLFGVGLLNFCSTSRARNKSGSAVQIFGRRSLKSFNDHGTGNVLDVLGLSMVTIEKKKILVLCNAAANRAWWLRETGICLGWASSCLYLGSRISQLVKNSQRKTADGLSLTMVACAVLANLTYGLAIIIRAKSWHDLIGKAPWLVGSLGTVSLDIAIFFQAQYLSYWFREWQEEQFAILG